MLRESVEELRQIENDPSNIRLFADPTEDEQLLAINNDPQSIQHIKKPLPVVMERAVELDPTSIQHFIALASPEIRFQAIQKNPLVIQYYKNSTYEEQKLAMSLVEEAYNLIPNRTERTHFYYILLYFKWLFLP